MQRAAAPSPRIILAVLSLGGISYALLQSLVVPALPEIQASLHTTESAIGVNSTRATMSVKIRAAAVEGPDVMRCENVV